MTVSPERALRLLWPKTLMVKVSSCCYFVVGYRLRAGVAEFPKADTIAKAWLQAAESADAPDPVGPRPRGGPEAGEGQVPNF